MKAILRESITLLLLVSSLSGCTYPNGRPDNTANGALIGGASGAAIGALADRRAPGVGALIGGAAGLVAGGLIGHSVDQENEARWQSPPPPVYATPPAVPPPTIADIKSMSRSGLSEDVIISQISSSHAVYNLDANAILDLNNAGVSQRVLSYMINTPNSVVAQGPPPPPTETVLVAPSPDYVWVGGEWVWNGGSWVWVGGRWVLPPRPHAFWVEGHWVHGPYGWHRVEGRWR